VLTASKNSQGIDLSSWNPSIGFNLLADKKRWNENLILFKTQETLESL